MTVQGCIPAPAGPGEQSLDTSLERVGVSPHLRGQPSGSRAPGADLGCIPAPAGPARDNRGRRAVAEVYPRACGASRRFSSTYTGVSPQPRGQLASTSRSSINRRCIPALAGPVGLGAIHVPTSEVYPRACGACPSSSKWSASSAGVFPQLRGQQAQGEPEADAPGCIPAPAGPAASGHLTALIPMVYPRRRGASLLLMTMRHSLRGVSPHVRG